MTTRTRLFRVLAASLWLSGCALQLEQSSQEFEDRQPDEWTEESPSNVYVAKPKSAATPAVVIALMSDAENQSRQGNLDQAASTIERALRIQPRNPELWHRLAELRFQQDQPKPAIDLAMKSNSLSGGNSRLKKRNWGLIAKARRQLGDAVGAFEAVDKANEL